MGFYLFMFNVTPHPNKGLTDPRKTYEEQKWKFLFVP